MGLTLGQIDIVPSALNQRIDWQAYEFIPRTTETHTWTCQAVAADLATHVAGIREAMEMIDDLLEQLMTGGEKSEGYTASQELTELDWLA